MRYRALSVTGDFVFGRGNSQFLVNTPETVAQAVNTRLKLLTEEWFLDLTEGTPYKEKVLGTGTMDLYDAAIQERILGTQGVTGITEYYSILDQDRHLAVGANLSTVYGETQFSTSL